MTLFEVCRYCATRSFSVKKLLGIEVIVGRKYTYFCPEIIFLSVSAFFFELCWCWYCVVLCLSIRKYIYIFLINKLIDNDGN